MKKIIVTIIMVFALSYLSCNDDTIIDTAPDAIPSPDTLPSINLTRCDDCKNSLKGQYTPRHDGKLKDGVFWEVPIKTAGDSIMPIYALNDDDYSNQILVVDSLEQLNSLRVMIGYPNISRPITHNYTSDFFDTSALIFVTVYTSSGGHVRYIYFYALVTDSQNFYPIFGLDLPKGDYGWTADIGRRSFLIEVDRAIVDNYSAGSLGMGKGWNSNWNKFDESINWLCGKCESGWEFTEPSDEWGIRIGNDDAILVRQDYNFSITDNRLHWSGGFGGSHEVYIKQPGMDEFEYLFDAWGSGNIDLVRFNLLEGISTIKIVGNNMEYIDGEYIRVYDYFEIETAAGYVESNYNFNVSILSGQMSMGLTWNSAGSYAVYVQRAGDESFEMVSALSNGTRGVLIDSFGLLEGINNIMLVTYKFENEKAMKNIARLSLVLESEKKQEYYAFKLVGGGLPNSGNWSGGHAITWEGGSNQFYERYVKRAGSRDFESIGSGPGSWAILLSELNLSDDTHTLRVEGWQFSGGSLRRIYSDFNFEVRTRQNSNINFYIDETTLRWDYQTPWYIHRVAVKRAGTDYFDVVTTLGTGGLDSWRGIELSKLDLKKGTNVVEVEVAWASNGNILTREAGYFSIRR